MDPDTMNMKALVWSANVDWFLSAVDANPEWVSCREVSTAPHIYILFLGSAEAEKGGRCGYKRVSGGMPKLLSVTHCHTPISNTG